MLPHAFSTRIANTIPYLPTRVRVLSRVHASLPRITRGIPGQVWAQLGGAAVTLAFALVSGTIVGNIVKAFGKGSTRAFCDDPFWTVAEKKTE